MVSSGTKRNAALRTALCSTASEPDFPESSRSSATPCCKSAIPIPSANGCCFCLWPPPIARRQRLPRTGYQPATKPTQVRQHPAMLQECHTHQDSVVVLFPFDRVDDGLSLRGAKVTSRLGVEVESFR